MQLEFIDLGRVGDDDAPIVNSTYDLWLETYTPILKTAGETIRPELFYRSKVLTLIRDSTKVLSFSLNNVLNLSLNGVDDLSYFSAMPKDILGHLKASRQKMFTIEWVTVHPDERAKLTKIRQSDLIMAISIFAMTNTHCDAAMGFSRIDLGADRLAAKFGARPHGTVSVHDIDCNVMIARKEWYLKPKHALLASIVSDLWKNKINKTQLVSDTKDGETYEAAI